ncbi:MAG: PAS domain S-box protein [Candidatus Scalinduaceae bacterium]
MNYERMTKAELISKLESLESSVEVAEHKKAEEQIRKLSHAIEQSSSIIMITDTKGNIEFVNPKFTQLTGYSREEVIGKTPRVLKSGETSPEVYKELWETITSGNEWRGEFCNKKKSGELYWEFASISPVKNAEGVITNFIAVKEDITERKQMDEELRKLNESLEQRAKKLVEKSEKLMSEIDKREQAEETLRESEEKYRGIFERVPVSIVLLDRNGQVIDINSYHVSHIGKGKTTREDYIGKNILTHPSIVNAGVSEIYADVLKGKPFDLKEVFFPTTTGGTAAYLNVKGVPLLKDGDVIGALTIHEDITERRKMEEELRKLNESLEQIVVERTKQIAKVNEELRAEIAKHKQTEDELRKSKETLTHAQRIARLGSWESDIVKNKTIWSDEIYRQFGLNLQEFDGKLESFLNSVHPDDKELVKKTINESLYKRRPYNIDFRIVSKDGTERILHSEAEVAFDDNGKPLKMIGTTQDITERKRIEEELRNSEEALHIASEEWERSFNALPDHICILDMSGAIMRANKTMRERFEPIHGDLKGLDYRLIYCGTATPDPQPPCAAVLSASPSVSAETQLPTMDGWQRVSSFPLFNKENKQIGAVSVVTDITERKRIEEVLLQSEKMKAVGEMTSGVAHEFDNMLAIISGNTQLLEERYRDDKELTKALHTICRVADDGAQIVDRMYEFTNVEVDRSRFVSVDMRHLIREAVGFTMPRWKNMAQAKGITYYIDMEGIKEVPPLPGNPVELKEVLVNLINNALDAMPDGGHLSFCTWKSDCTIFVSVSDTGKGMPEEVQKRIFDPFFTTRRPEGSGLGMSVSYGIMKRYGGKINVKSEMGKGSTLTICLPVTSNTARSEISSKPTKEKTARILNILVVDDEEDMCEVLSNFFTKEGHKVRSVNSGAEAIKLAKSNGFDLVICDLVMPEVTGRDVIKALDALDKRPRVGLITGWRYEIKDVKKEDLNVDFIVKKPFKFSELRRDISNVLKAKK